jgi:acetyl esterase/lipase
MTSPEAAVFAERLRELTSEPGAVMYRWTDVEGIRCLWAEPDGEPMGVVQYVHGGAYVVGSARAYRRLTGHLARVSGCAVVSVEYRLAPEHPFPAPVDDCLAAYRGLLDAGFEPSRVALAGDSAGAGLALNTLHRLPGAELPMPATAVLLSPWVDLELGGASIEENVDLDLLLRARDLRAGARAHLAGTSPRDPAASSLHADLSRCCPLYIQAGSDEILLDDARRLSAHAAAHGVRTTLDVVAGMQHVFQIGAGYLPEATDAIERIAAHLQEHLPGAPAVRGAG